MACSCCNQGTSGLAAVDLTTIGLDQLTALLQTIPEGDLVAKLKQLPESTIRQICTTGVNEELQGYLPWILLAAAGLGVFLIMK